MRKAGFTGTRHGMTEAQEEAFRKILIREEVGELHHGDCLGSDARAHTLARERGMIRIVGHPPSDDKLRAYCECDVLRYPKDYLIRDQAIVDETDFLIATPDSPNPRNRSGTWYTIRRGHMKPDYDVIIIFPDGSYEHG